jgi:AraC family transcriptional regulator of arabinose operon
MNAIEEILLWVDTANSPAHSVSADTRIHEIVRFLRENYRSTVTIDALARRCALSPSRFAHLFREQTGVSPMRYVERLRVARAQELLLTTNTSIAEVAYQCGYENPLYFSHVFKRSSGRSPRSFRKGSVR